MDKYGNEMKLCKVQQQRKMNRLQRQKIRTKEHSSYVWGKRKEVGGKCKANAHEFLQKNVINWGLY